ncbi:hypothetical protein ES703_87778 [subsurface metagenome]
MQPTREDMLQGRASQGQPQTTPAHYQPTNLVKRYAGFGQQRLAAPQRVQQAGVVALKQGWLALIRLFQRRT